MRTILALGWWCVAALVPVVAADPPTQTATGIPLDAPWKVTSTSWRERNFVHPAWGWQHSERNYRVGISLAQSDGLKVDRDVLFAAAFLHDMAAFMPCADPHLEHGECAAQESGPILRDAGFPMAKFPDVAAAERGHMYYRDPGAIPAAIVLHDADSLDFLGEIGAARMIALTGEKAPSFAPGSQEPALVPARHSRAPDDASGEAYRRRAQCGAGAISRRPRRADVRRTSDVGVTRSATPRSD